MFNKPYLMLAIALEVLRTSQEMQLTAQMELDLTA